MAWNLNDWAKHERQRVEQAVRGGPVAIRTLIDDYEARVEQNFRAGESDWLKLHGAALQVLYNAGGEEYQGRKEYMQKALTAGKSPLSINEWTPGQTTIYYDPETGTGADDIEEMPEEYQETAPTSGDSDWREMQAPPNWVKSMASKQGGEQQLQYMAMQNALAGRNAAVDQLASFDEEAKALSQPLITPEEEAAMLALQDSTLAMSYENQRLGAQHGMGMRGIDPRSGVNQELMAALRFGTLAEQSRQTVNTQLQNKQINRSALERAIGLRTGIQGAMANLMAGQPLTNLAASAASMINQGNMYQAARDDAKSDALNPMESLAMGFGNSLVKSAGSALSSLAFPAPAPGA